MTEDEIEARLAKGQAVLAQMAADGCARAKRRLKRGDKGAILEAVFQCATSGTPLPGWLCKVFSRAYLETVIGPPLHHSWDEVFGRPHGKHEKLPAKLQARKLRFRVYVAVIDKRAKEPRKDHFPAIAEQFKIGTSHCKTYFNSVHKAATSKDETLAYMTRWLIEEARRQELFK